MRAADLPFATRSALGGICPGLAGGLLILSLSLVLAAPARAQARAGLRVSARVVPVATIPAQDSLQHLALQLVTNDSLGSLGMRLTSADRAPVLRVESDLWTLELTRPCPSSRGGECGGLLLTLSCLRN